MSISTAADRRRRVVVAGHQGDVDAVLEHVADPDAGVRASALGALERLGRLEDDQLRAALRDVDADVRVRAAELCGTRPDISLLEILDDPDPRVVETGAWGCGEQVAVADTVIDRLCTLTTGADEPLVREAAAAALGAIGDPRGVDAIIAACADKPHVRRRAVLALAPFEGDEVDAAIERALIDRDWQVRQAAEDLRRATGELDL